MWRNLTRSYAKIVMLILSAVISMILVACTTDATDIPPTVELTAIVDTPLAEATDETTETPPPPPHEDARLDLYCAIISTALENRVNLLDEALSCPENVVIAVGETLLVYAHPVSIGLVNYRLQSAQDDISAEFNPRSSMPPQIQRNNNPFIRLQEEIGIYQDAAQFNFAAVAPGTVSLSVTVSGEISDFSYFDGAWQPMFQWGAVSAQPLEVSIVSD